MSAPALICDTGALLDYLDAGARDHRLFRKAIDQARARYVPGLVLAEVDYFLRDARRAMRSLIDDICRGAFLLAPATETRLARAMQIDEEMADVGLGLVDASVVALAEELGIVRLATRDVRDFSRARLGGGRVFEFVVMPSTSSRRGKRPRART